LLTIFDRVISLGLHLQFPPHSPDTTPLDSQLLAIKKNQVSKQKSNNFEEFQNEITDFINKEMLQNIFQNMKRRVRECLENNGEYF
jgi:hypothetical protein